MACVIVEMRNDDRPTDEELEREARALDASLAKRGGHWERSYLSADGTKMVCEFEAQDAQSVRDALAEAKVAYEMAWQAERWRIEDQRAPAKREPETARA